MNTAQTADNAIKETAATYMRNVGVDLNFERLERSIREKPLAAAGLAAGAGFILGGGMATRPALALLALFGRKAARDTTASFMKSMVSPGKYRPRAAQSVSH
jgi:hypothetical protein